MRRIFYMFHGALAQVFGGQGPEIVKVGQQGYPQDQVGPHRDGARETVVVGHRRILPENQGSGRESEPSALGRASHGHHIQARMFRANGKLSICRPAARLRKEPHPIGPIDRPCHLGYVTQRW